jgi:hypothetical protein
MNPFKKSGRQPFDPADIEARRNDFQRLRRHLGVSAAVIAKITGLKTGTVKNYSAPQRPNIAATWETIVLMREEATYRKIAEIKRLEESLFRAEVDLQQIMRTGIPASSVAGKSSLSNAAAVTDGQGEALQGGPGYPHHSPLPSSPAAAVAVQI